MARAPASAQTSAALPAAAGAERLRAGDQRLGQPLLARVARGGLALRLLERLGDQAHDGFPSSSRIARRTWLPESSSGPAT